MKKMFSFVLLFLYEILRGTYIFTTRPEFSIEILPVSWYVTIPSLLFPFIFLYCLFHYSTDNEMMDKSNFSSKTTEPTANSSDGATVAVANSSVSTEPTATTANLSKFLFILCKFISDIGLGMYIYRDFMYAITYGAYNNYYSLRRLLSLVLFLVFDVIIVLVMVFSNKKTDGSKCK